MAFVNEKLTPTQREELAKKKIKNPYGSFRDTTEGIMPLYLTIDKNSETWLAHCYNHHDTITPLPKNHNHPQTKRPYRSHPAIRSFFHITPKLFSVLQYLSRRYLAKLSYKKCAYNEV